VTFSFKFSFRHPSKNFDRLRMDMKTKRIHLAGIAGVGMSALAQALLDAGYTVSGSDRYLDQGREIEVLTKLRGQGVELYRQDGCGINTQTVGLAVSTAIEADNPDLLAAHRLGVPIRHRAEWLADLVNGNALYAVAGTCGKTTVTGMLGRLLEFAGKDPSVVDGGEVLDWITPDRLGNVRAGAGSVWVCELDESDRSLLNFHPRWAIVTNISRDHFELDETRELFRQFAGQVSEGIICGPGVADVLVDAANCRLVDCATRGMAERAGAFTLDGHHYAVSLMGRHNAENAFLAALLCLELGLSPEVIASGLQAFRGIRRRLESAGWMDGVEIIDDYAHNPAKIAAAWSAARKSNRRVLGVWRPHGFGPLAAMQDDLRRMFGTIMGAEDRLYVLPVYYAGGTTHITINSSDFVRQLDEAGVPVEYADNYDRLEQALRAAARSGDVILIMGARDPELPEFAHRLVSIHE